MPTEQKRNPDRAKYIVWFFVMLFLFLALPRPWNLLPAILGFMLLIGILGKERP